MNTTPRATKIVATLGPSSSDPETLRRLLQAGVNVVRVNFSHGKSEEHVRTIEAVRELAGQMQASTSACSPTSRARRSASASSTTAR